MDSCCGAVADELDVWFRSLSSLPSRDPVVARRKMHVCPMLEHSRHLQRNEKHPSCNSLKTAQIGGQRRANFRN